jgi:hypothetical protein
MKNTALLIAGFIFAIVALAHLLRLYYGSDVIIAGYMIPMWVSYVGFIIPLGLSIWMFTARKQK